MLPLFNLAYVYFASVLPRSIFKHYLVIINSFLSINFFSLFLRLCFKIYFNDSFNSFIIAPILII